MKTSPRMTIYAVSRTTTHLQVVAPYNPYFISAAKSNLGARWDGTAWTFDIRDEAEAMTLIEGFYGWKPGMALVSVKLFVDKEKRVDQGPFVMLGRVLASATGRDSGAKLGDGVRLHDGKVGSGGSVKNWLTVIDESTELVVHDVPEEMARSYVDGSRTKKDVRVEILETASVVDATALSTERLSLLARLLEVDKLLENCGEVRNCEHLGADSS